MRTLNHKSTTVYNVETRSALEARWAIFFRELKLDWRYEPTSLHGGGRSYTPDFLVTGFGYVEIKPTLDLFIAESSERIAAITKANPAIKIYGFITGRVEIGQTVLYSGDKLFAPEPRHIYRLLSRARTGVSALSITDQDVDIKRAMQVANTTKFNGWYSMAETLQQVIANISGRL